MCVPERIRAELKTGGTDPGAVTTMSASATESWGDDAATTSIGHTFERELCGPLVGADRVRTLSPIVRQSLLQSDMERRTGRLTPWKGGEAVVTWNGLIFAVAFAMLVLAIVAFNTKDRP